MKSSIRSADRITTLNLPPFDFIHQSIEWLRNSGEVVIDLTQGVVHLPAKEIIADTVIAGVRNPTIYDYSSGSGLLLLREVLAKVLLTSTLSHKCSDGR